ncbi:MAG: ion transporter [Nitrososphaerota archaeon]|jgi:Mg2+ and Co2+ transporter CorA|nr:ion transporter [Nitrososphaerota archaeon]MDG6967487.1 ion transporter [Nitrososphaerota archaeon]MDG6978349.1 ion transporter [Nitrososphaerota archaeon]
MPEADHRHQDDALPRSIFVPREDPRKDARETVNVLLSDRFMAFLSVILIPIILLPLLVDLSASVLSFFDICDVTVIVVFVVEYFSKLYLAKSRWEYFRSPWHLVDLAVVVLSFVSYLPLIEFGSRGSASLLLRLLRLPRALAVGGRTAGSRIRSQEANLAGPEGPPETVIRQVEADLKTGNPALTWEDVEMHLATDKQEWIDVSNIGEQGVLRLGAMLRVPPAHFRARQVDDFYPHIDYLQEMSFIFLQSGEISYPTRADQRLTIARRGQVVICRGDKIITASPHGTDVFTRALPDVQSRLEEHGFAASVLYGILDSTLREYRSVFSDVEVEVSKIGNTPRSRLPKDFLQRMYELNKEVARLVSNLVHFKDLLGVIISRRVTLTGFGTSAEEDFSVLQDETSFLTDIADDVQDRLHTLIQLYISQSSFETNRVLKILAVITALSIIPTAIGTMLGMNLADTPYHLQLWQVSVVVAFSMAFIAYCFVKLGWLRA